MVNLFYLLISSGSHSMLAIMTMNVGYFFSVLAGVFTGTLVIGRFGGRLEH